MRLRLSQLSCGVSVQQHCGFSSSAPPPVKLAFERYGSSSDKRTNPLAIKYMQSTSEIMVTHHMLMLIPMKQCVHLLGHSMGGKVVSQFALSQSNLSQKGVIAKLIVEDIVPSRSYIASEFADYISAMKAVDLGKSRREISEQLKVAVRDNGILQFLMTNLDVDAKQKNHFRWKCNLGFRGPTLVVYGANSSYISRDDREEMLKMFPSAEFIEIPDAGHWLHAEQPRLFIDCLAEYLNK
uniref:sn-1-specific diacylglycerol lipase ABHD11 n=1 Tax=Ditylenchus dipsaci TaxID=166011 RepID=A0A915DMR6_9BILA